MTAPILRRLADLRAKTSQWRRAGEVIGVVPTMGALHEGHLSLAETARANCDRVIVTIFVNPKQFNNPEDLEKYPRTETEDAAKLSPYGVDVIYVPEPEEIYPAGFASTVSVAGLTDVIGAARRIDFRTESKTRIQRYGCRRIVKGVLRAASLMARDRRARQFVSDGSGALSKDMLHIVGYGVYAGRKLDS